MSDDPPRASEPATAVDAIRAVLTLPAIIGVAVPIGVAQLDPWRAATLWPGLALVVLGWAIVFSTVRDFYRHGRGTLAPWDPPRHLVTVGLFARCRNPMYVGVVTNVAGWAVLFSSPIVGAYAALLPLGFHIRVLLHEEPWAARTFPDAWPRYVENVPRWLPRLRPWRPAA